MAAWRYWSSSSCMQANPGTGVQFPHSDSNEHLTIIALQMTKGELLVTVKDDETSTRVTSTVVLFRSWTGARDSSVLCNILTSSWAPHIPLISECRDCVLGIKRPEPKTDYSSSASVWVKNAWSYTSTHQHTLLMCTVRPLCRLVTVWSSCRLQFTVWVLAPCSFFVS